MFSVRERSFCWYRVLTFKLSRSIYMGENIYNTLKEMGKKWLSRSPSWLKVLWFGTCDKFENIFGLQKLKMPTFYSGDLVLTLSAPLWLKPKN